MGVRLTTTPHKNTFYKEDSKSRRGNGPNRTAMPKKRNRKKGTCCPHL
jgi:hypothetical protein